MLFARIDDIYEKLYEFEVNKKNNLIFYGIAGEHRETPSDLLLKVRIMTKFKKTLLYLFFFRLHQFWNKLFRLKEISSFQKLQELWQVKRINIWNNTTTHSQRSYSSNAIKALYYICSLGPDVAGCRPVVVTFEDFNDREQVELMSQVKQIKLSGSAHG